MNALDPVKNFAKVTLASGYSSSDGSVYTIANDGAKLPQPSTDGSFNLVWWNSTDYPDPTDDPSKEIVRCYSRTNDNLLITRGTETTSAANHNTGSKVYKMAVAPTKKLVDDLNTKFGWIKAGSTTITTGGTPQGLQFTTPYFSGLNYVFIPFGMLGVDPSTVTYDTRTYSGLTLYAADDGTVVNWVAIGTI